MVCVDWWFAFVGICDDLQGSALIELIPTHKKHAKYSWGKGKIYYVKITCRHLMSGNARSILRVLCNER